MARVFWVASPRILNERYGLIAAVNFRFVRESGRITTKLTCRGSLCRGEARDANPLPRPRCSALSSTDMDFPRYSVSVTDGCVAMAFSCTGRARTQFDLPALHPRGGGRRGERSPSIC